MSSQPHFAGSVPTNYNRFLGPLLFTPYAEDIAQRIPEGVHSILELACGTGLVTAQLAKRFGHVVKVTATDLNPDMIVVAKKEVTTAGIEWQTADMQQLPFADNSFDCVICQFGLMFVPDKRLAFREAYRVVKKGGRFIFNTWDRIENVATFAVGNSVIQNFFNHNAPPFFKIPFSMFDPHELEQLLTQSGFTNPKVELIKKEGHAETAMHAARGIVEGNPIYKEIMDIDPAAVKTLEEKISSRLEAIYGNESLKPPMQAFVGEGVK